jgi:uncharacterized membrane protein
MSITPSRSPFMPDTDTPNVTDVARSARLVALSRALAVGCLIGLMVLGLAWELWLAPLRPGGSWLVLKVLPLTLPLAGLLKNRMYTYRWVSLVVWLYFTEGVVRAWSDKGLSAALAGVEIALCLTLFVAVTVHVRTRLKAAGQDAVEADKLRHAAAIGAAADPVKPAKS